MVVTDSFVQWHLYNILLTVDKEYDYLIEAKIFVGFLIFKFFSNHFFGLF